MLHLVGFLSSRFTHDARSQEHKTCLCIQPCSPSAPDLSFFYYWYFSYLILKITGETVHFAALLWTLFSSCEYFVHQKTEIILLLIIILIIINKETAVQLDKKHWYEHVPKSVETSPEGKVTILWNQQVQTDRTIPNNKPDITIRDNEKGTCMLIDVAISGDRNVTKKWSRDDSKI